MRRTVGSLCLLSFMLGLGFAGWYAYVVLAPFFRGAEVRQFWGEGYDSPEGPVGLNTASLAEQVALSGLNQSAEPLLRGAVKGTRPHVVQRAWEALPQLGETWMTYKTPVSGTTNIEWIAVADAGGKVVASYPDGLFDQMSSVRTPTSTGWYGALRAYKRPPSRIEVIQIPKPGNPEVSLGSMAIARRSYEMIAVIPPKAAVTSTDLSMTTTLILSACGFLLGAILLPIWVAMDADWRGMRGGAWAVLVVVTGLIGLAAYLIARLAPPKACPNCGEMIHSGYKRCPACGVTLLVKCPQCGRKLGPGWQYCPRCTAEGEDDGVSVATTGQPEEAREPEAAESVRVRLEPESNGALPTVSHFALGVTVVDAATGGPIAGATVSIAGATAVEGRTGAKGYFEARTLLSGAYNVSASAPSYDLARIQVNVGQDEANSVRLALNPRLGAISGRVLERSTMHPVPGSRVFVDSARLERTTIADSDGVYVLGDIPPGPYTVCAEVDGYARQTRLAEVEAGQHATVGFALEAVQAAEQEENADAIQ